MTCRVYEVIVSNIGCVYAGSNLRDARFHARHYVDQSKCDYGRAAGESVTVFRVIANLDVEIIEEYVGTRGEA